MYIKLDFYYDDFNNIEEAIEAALKGACLTKNE